MKRWALLTVALYFAALVALAAPLILACFFYPPVITDSNLPDKVREAREALDVYRFWPYWVWVGVMVLCQAAVLLVPVRAAAGRPVPRRSVWLTVTVSGLMVGLLFMAMAASVLEFISKEPAPKYEWQGWAGLALGLALWLGWTAVFALRSRGRDPLEFVTGQMRWLRRGSILTLLVAVPAHVVARHRDYCCAGFSTFAGIASGLAVLLFAFGPGVFLLYFARWRRLQPAGPPREAR